MTSCGRGVEPPSSAYETDERTGALNRIIRDRR